MIFLMASLGFSQEAEICKRTILPALSQIPGWCFEKKAAAGWFHHTIMVFRK
jgi:hypothetical protein